MSVYIFIILYIFMVLLYIIGVISTSLNSENSAICQHKWLWNNIGGWDWWTTIIIIIFKYII